VLHNLTLSDSSEFEEYLQRSELFLEFQRARTLRQILNTEDNDGHSETNDLYAYPSDSAAEARGKALRDALARQLQDDDFDPNIHIEEHDYHGLLDF